MSEDRQGDSSTESGPRNETAEHWLLKRLSLDWAFRCGFHCISFEVRAPRSSFRVDVAGYRSARDREPNTSTVAVFECKQSRPDLSRDSAQTIAVENELRALQQRRERLEKLLAIHYPASRVACALFPEWDPFDPEQLGHSGYRRLVARILALQRKLERNIKFERVTRYRLANLHFLVTTKNLVTPTRVPPGWGLLEAVDNQRLELRIPPRFYQIANEADWLERIGKSATYRWLKTTGLLPLEPVDQSVTAPKEAGLT